jgi:hypothetical protein
MEKHHGCECKGRHHRGSCDCDNRSHFKRRFLTREEKVARLEQYLENLQLEAQAVEEHIALLQAE